MAVDIIQMAVLGRAGTQSVANVLHWAAAVEESPDPLGLCNDLMDAWEAAAGALEQYLDCLPDNYTYLGARCRRMNNTGGPTVTRAGTGTGTRTGSADFSGAGPVGLLHVDAGGGIIQWRTGKIFFPSASVSDVVQDVFDAALRAAIIAFINFCVAAIGAGPNGPFTLGVYNRTANVFREAIGSSVSGKVGTQRRRYVPL